MAQEEMNLDAAGKGEPNGEPVELQPIDEAAPIRLPAKKSPFLTRGNLMLVAMFAAGIAGVYALSLRSSPTSAMAGQEIVHAKVEAALNVLEAESPELRKRQHGNAQAIVNEFYMAAKQRQIPLERLRGNPFAFQAIQPAQPDPNKNRDANTPPKPRIDKELQQAMKAVEALRLQAVMGGDPPTALISGNPVRVGMVVNGWIVTHIRAREVELAWRDRKYVLEMPK